MAADDIFSLDRWARHSPLGKGNASNYRHDKPLIWPPKKKEPTLLALLSGCHMEPFERMERGRPISGDGPFGYEQLI